MHIYADGVITNIAAEATFTTRENYKKQLRFVIRKTLLVNKYPHKSLAFWE